MFNLLFCFENITKLLRYYFGAPFKLLGSQPHDLEVVPPVLLVPCTASSFLLEWKTNSQPQIIPGERKYMIELKHVLPLTDP